ncbi:MAG: MFS transporter [Alphaproteobacteria bacterium]|nr:MFS transporter [Alphaproteobacteria bacterium]
MGIAGFGRKLAAMPISDILGSRLLALPLRNPNFGIYSAGSAVSLTGMWMERIAVGWLTWQLTESGFWLGVVAFADFFPVVLIGPIAGAAADRWDRLKVVKASQSILLVQATVLWALTATGHINIGLIVALTAVHGIVVAFNQPARLALVPSLVPQQDFGSAVALNSVVFNTARFIGPIFAGFAIVGSGVAAAFLINALTYVVFLVALARIRIVEPDAEPEVTARRRSFVTDLRDGIRYTATHPGIAALFVLLTALGIGGRPITELLPGFADEIYKAGAGGLSILASAIGGGAIVGGLWLGHRAHDSNMLAVTLATTVVSVFAIFAAIATESMWIAVPAMIVFGFCNSTSGIASQTLVQLASDRAMRGRVMGLYGLIFRGGPSIGALAAGAATTYFGLRWPVFVGALLVLVAALWTLLRRARIETALGDARPVAKPGDG